MKFLWVPTSQKIAAKSTNSEFFSRKTLKCHISVQHFTPINSRSVIHKCLQSQKNWYLWLKINHLYWRFIFRDSIQTICCKFTNQLPIVWKQCKNVLNIFLHLFYFQIEIRRMIYTDKELQYLITHYESGSVLSVHKVRSNSCLCYHVIVPNSRNGLFHLPGLYSK